MSEAAIAAAQARIEATRARLFGTIEDVQSRFSPDALTQDAFESLREGTAQMMSDGVQAVRSRPGIIAGAATLFGLYLARRPIARAIRNATRSRANS